MRTRFVIESNDVQGLVGGSVHVVTASVVFAHGDAAEAFASAVRGGSLTLIVYDAAEAAKLVVGREYQLELSEV